MTCVCYSSVSCMPLWVLGVGHAVVSGIVGASCAQKCLKASDCKSRRSLEPLRLELEVLQPGDGSTALMDLDHHIHASCNTEDSPEKALPYHSVCTLLLSSLVLAPNTTHAIGAQHVSSYTSSPPPQLHQHPTILLSLFTPLEGLTPALPCHWGLSCPQFPQVRLV